MSMHLCGPALTTTSYKKRKTKVTKAQQEDLERGWRDRNQRLKEMRLPKETFEQYLEWVYGKGKKDKGQKNSGKKITKAYAAVVVGKKETSNHECTSNKNTVIRTGIESQVTEPTKTDLPSHGRVWVTGACTTKPSPTYTGTKIIGIGTMHKSNMVPIFSDEEAVDIARMRR
jgi:hypothetical protein